MAYEIDHLFICVSAGAPEADLLVQFGLAEGSANLHPGQGTANRRFFFRNAMLELLWVFDPHEAQGEMARRTKLWERWAGRQGKVSPFGVCLRPAPPGSEQPPFSAWEYRPPYLPDDLVIHVGEDTPLTEPMWFFLAFARRPDAAELDRREPLEHPLGVRELTGIRIVAPGSDQLSPIAANVIETGLLFITSGQQYLLELVFNGNPGGRQKDFRPELPLVIRW